jgi:magnesium-transporting ATPase (P-type)
MSTIVRGADGRIKIYTKGADTVIYERLARTSELSDATLVHLEVSFLLFELADSNQMLLCIGLRYRGIKDALLGIQKYT